MLTDAGSEYRVVLIFTLKKLSLEVKWRVFNLPEWKGKKEKAGHKEKLD